LKGVARRRTRDGSTRTREKKVVKVTLECGAGEKLCLHLEEGIKSQRGEKATIEKPGVPV